MLDCWCGSSQKILCAACAVKTLAAARSSQGARPGDPLFVNPGLSRMSRAELASLARAALQCLGLPATGVTAHSFRGTGAVFYCAAGIEKQRIMALGRWSSEAIDRYLRDTPNVT
eukprot:6133505-Amphidinium_carterae.1